MIIISKILKWGITMSEKREVLFEAKNITKTFGTTVALDDVDLTIYRGEIRGLIGENGSGKSTISSIAAGMQKADKGTMIFKGAEHKPLTMIDGAKAGFGMIVQEAGTVSGITVAQNIFLGKEKEFAKFGIVNKKAMNAAAKEALENIGFKDIDPSIVIDALDLQQRKLVEVAKVMYEHPDIMVVDETTTALSQEGREIVYQLMQRQKEEGKAVMFISHDLDEVMEHCDSLTVLRDGKLIRTLEKDEFEVSLVKKCMVGREIGERYYREDKGREISEEVVLEAKNLTSGLGSMKNVSLQLHKGEILGIAGLSDCGMHELGRALFGEERLAYGEVYVGEKKIDGPKTAISCGVGYVSKDRDREALVLSASIRDNIVAAGMDKVSNSIGIISKKAEKCYVKEQMDKLSIKCADMDQTVKELSGGNKQKVVFGKWIGRDADILILDCPTRGVDIGVKAAMYQLMDDMAKSGKSIIIIGEEMLEVIGMSDRILVMKDGRINGELYRKDNITENEVLDYMI